jgi:hypothetical protein
MPRFVVLRHDGPGGVHWDLLLEAGPVLRTWSLPQPPEEVAEQTCRSLADHRMAYLDYEGPISDGRGHVEQWDRGTYQVECETPRELRIELSGTRLVGHATLCKLPNEPDGWSYSFRRGGLAS